MREMRASAVARGRDGDGDADAGERCQWVQGGNLIRACWCDDYCDAWSDYSGNEVSET